MARILVVGGEPVLQVAMILRETIADLLRAAGYEVSAVSALPEAVHALQTAVGERKRFDVVVVDSDAGVDGVQILGAVRSMMPLCYRLLFVGSPGREMAEVVRKREINTVVYKPHTEQILEMIKDHLARVPPAS